jgi:hypothetical protein
MEIKIPDFINKQETVKREFYLKRKILGQIVLVDGIARSGKFLLGNILMGLNRMEHIQYFPMFEILSNMANNGLLSKKAAAALIQTEANMHIYEYEIGRNLNFRLGDKSSIFNSPQLKNLMQKCHLPDGATALKRILKERKKYPFITHGLLANINIFLSAISNVKMVHIFRHPIDMVCSWYNRGWGKRFGNDPLDFNPALTGLNQTPIPIEVFGWQPHYESLSEIERVIKHLEFSYKTCLSTYDNLSLIDKKKIMFISYESLVTDPIKQINRISRFLKTKLSESISVILAKENCPAYLSANNRTKKIKAIKSAALNKSLTILHKIEKKYYTKMLKLAKSHS